MTKEQKQLIEIIEKHNPEITVGEVSERLKNYSKIQNATKEDII